MQQIPGRKPRLNRVGTTLLLLVLLGVIAVVAGAYLTGGLGWALVSGGLLLVGIGLRLDVL